MTNDSTPRPSDGATSLARGGVGIGNVLIGLGILSLVAVIIFIVMSANRDRALRTDAVTSAASDLAGPRPVTQNR